MHISHLIISPKRRSVAEEFKSFEKLPGDIFSNIFSKLELETLLTTLCSVASVSRTVHSTINQTLYVSSIDFSAFSLYPQAFSSKEDWKIRKISFDCLHFNDSSIRPFLGLHVEELVLLKCHKIKFSYSFLSYIGRTCPYLRVFTLEISALIVEPTIFDSNLKGLLKGCRLIETLCIKVRGLDCNGFTLGCIYDLLPENIKVLKLDTASASDTVVSLRSLSASDSPVPFGRTLTHISLVIDKITNSLLTSIASSLPLLTNINLKDRPRLKPLATDDLNNLGIQSLINCKHLTSLSLRRSQIYGSYCFRFVTDTAMYFLAEGCKQLEYLRLVGFLYVTRVGFQKVLSSCLNLKKLEIRFAADPSYAIFQELSKLRKSLVEVKLVSCENICSKIISQLATCRELEVLDLHGCEGIGDSCLRNILCLTSLMYLNLRETRITDAGMAVLGKGDTPISRLSLRGCTRITDEGIALLLASEGKIVKTLSSLDLGYVYGITDKAITTIVDSCVGLTELCIR